MFRVRLFLNVLECGKWKDCACGCRVNSPSAAEVCDDKGSPGCRPYGPNHHDPISTQSFSFLLFGNVSQSSM